MVRKRPRWESHEGGTSARKRKIQNQGSKLPHFSPKYPEIWLYNHLKKKQKKNLIISPHENLPYVFNSFFFSLDQFSQLLTGLLSLVNHTRDFLGGPAVAEASEAESAAPSG